MSQDMLEIKKSFEALSRSPNGKVVLQYLRERYLEGTVVGKSPEETTIKAAQHDLVQTIINLATKELSNDR